MLAVNNPENVRQSRPSNVPSPQERVFGNDLLLDKILKYAIHDKNKLNMDTVKNCKLVQRQWPDRVTAVAYKSDTRSPIKLNIIENSWKVREFLQTFKDLPGKRVPPYSLEVTQPESDVGEYRCPLSKRMRRDALECLTRCGERLVTLKMDCFPATWSLFQKLSPRHIDADSGRFPHLKEMSIKEYIQPAARKCNGKRSKNLIQWILDGTECLRSFTLEQVKMCDAECAPEDVKIRNLNLPNTVTYIRLYSDIEECQRSWKNILLGKDLPHLTNLSLSGPVDGQEALHYSILDRLSHQLKKLEIQDKVYHEISLPVMESVEELTYFGSRWYCEDALGRRFPALEKIRFSTPDRQVMQKWLGSGISPGVDFAYFQYVFENQIVGSLLHELEIFVGINHVFPNVTNFSVEMILDKSRARPWTTQ